MMRSALGTVGRRLERILVGSVPESMRYNLWIETIASIAFGVFNAVALSFMPVVLRNLGASAEVLAFYTAQTYLGSVLSIIGVFLMRRYRPLVFAVACWLIGRSMLLWTFLITGAHWLVVLTMVFWVMEGLPSPAYARIIQTIYPRNYRGRALAIVRVGMVLAILIATPLAGIGLDHLGYRVLFPLASLLGLLSALLFSRMRIVEPPTATEAAPSLRGMLAILRQNRAFVMFLAAFTLYGLGFLMAMPFFAIVQVDRLKLSYTTIGYLALAQSLFWLLGNMFWGRLVDRFGGLWVLRVNIAIAIIVPLSYIWAFDVWTLLPAFIAHGIISAGMDLGVLSTGIELAGAESVVQYSAIQTSVIGLRGFIGPFLGIGLVGLGLSQTAVFAIGCVLIVLAWLCMGAVLAPGRRAAPR